MHGTRSSADAPPRIAFQCATYLDNHPARRPSPPPPPQPSPRDEARKEFTRECIAINGRILAATDPEDILDLVVLRGESFSYVNAGAWFESGVWAFSYLRARRRTRRSLNAERYIAHGVHDSSLDTPLAMT